MDKADAAAVAGGVSSLTLMERAGEAVAAVIMQRWPQRPLTLIVCGPGNNGGDGFVIARQLKAKGWRVQVAGSREGLKGDARDNALRWVDELVPLASVQPANYGLIVDALFGAGLSRDIDGELKTLIARMNDSAVPIVSVDMPSGVCGTTGRVRGAAVQAECSVTFCRLKPGHLLLPGKTLAGEVVLADIGITDAVVASIGAKAFANFPELWRDALPKLAVETHKYQRGYAVVVAGPKYATGAARLAARAALRAGAGIVRLAAEKQALAEIAAYETEVMVGEACDENEFTALLNDKRVSALCIGPGLGMSERGRELLHAALKDGRPVVIDADAITLLAGEKKLRGMLQPHHVLTPHAGEFERLCADVLATSESRLEAARAAAQNLNCSLVLKGPDSVIAYPDGRAAINTTGTPWLATAGSGDVLAGIITSLLAQGMNSFDAACAGVWLHGRCGEQAGAYLIAGDLIRVLPTVMTQAVRARIEA